MAAKLADDALDDVDDSIQLPDLLRRAENNIEGYMEADKTL